jgi:hypothetical protein
MHFVDHVTIFSCVEFVNVDVTLRSTGEQVSTIRESDFSATLNGNGLE